MSRFLILVVALFIGIAELNAQCQISGNLIDSGKEAVAYGNVFIEGVDSQIKVGALTDDKGYFCLKNIRKGAYKLTVSMMGFETYSTQVTLTDDDLNVILPDILLQTSNTNLAEVIVTGTAHVSQIKPSSIKYKTSSLISESGGTAGDILKNMPSVAMGGSPGHNRDIRFRGLGNAYTKVLINGRESGLSGNNRETVLDQIPAASISYIEIIAVPGSEYQSEGINGIVNIVLKDNLNYGLHGKVEAMAGNHDGQAGGFSLANKTEKLNLFANYDFLRRNVPKPKDKLKTDLKDGQITQIENSYEYEDKSFTNHNLRTGFDYYFKPKTKFTGEYIFGYQLEDKDKNLDFTRTDGSGKFKSRGQELKTEYKPNEYHQVFSALEHTFSNQAKFSVNASYQTEEQKKTEEKATYVLTQAGKWANFQPALENKNEMQKGEKLLWNANITKLKLAKNLLTFGYSGELDNRIFNNTTDKFSYKDTAWTKSSNGFDNFKVTETTHAFYVSDEYNVCFLKLKTGLRFEATQTVGNAETTSLEGDKSYGLLLPSASATFNIDKTQYITLNFGRRIRRPGFKDLNPFTEQKEPTKISKGNPALKPEKAWAYEVGYLKNFDKFNVGANLFYRDITDVIQKTITEDENNIVTEQPQNTGRAYVAGYELMSTLNPFDFWQLTASFSQFESEITSGDYQGDALADQYKWSAKAITDFTFPHGWSLQLSGNAVGPKISNTKEESTIWFADFGVEKKILTNGAFTFRMTDLFDSLSKIKTEKTDKSVTNETEYALGQLFLVGLNWKF
jgi:outer membrane receptor for ferrienterochelin and colicin